VHWLIKNATHCHKHLKSPWRPAQWFIKTSDTESRFTVNTLGFALCLISPCDKVAAPAERLFWTNVKSSLCRQSSICTIRLT
jgi:hypothetical protein